MIITDIGSCINNTVKYMQKKKIRTAQYLSVKWTMCYSVKWNYENTNIFVSLLVQGDSIIMLYLHTLRPKKLKGTSAGNWGTLANKKKKKKRKPRQTRKMNKPTQTQIWSSEIGSGRSLFCKRFNQVLLKKPLK